MSGVGIAALGFAAMLLLIAVRMPVGLSMLVTGAAGYVYLSGWSPFLAYMKTNPYYQFANYTLSVIPLFILMGALAERSGLSTALFKAAEVFAGRMRGGLAMAVIWACTAFGAICGSSVATTATFGRAALPELHALPLRRRLRHRHHRRRRHARHPHPALGHPRRLRHHDRAEHRQAVQGGADPGPACRALLLHRDRLVVRRRPHLAPAALGRGRRPAGRIGLQRLARPAGRLDRRRRHLRRRLHADRGRRRRRRRHAAGRRGAALACPGRASSTASSRPPRPPR